MNITLLPSECIYLDQCLINSEFLYLACDFGFAKRFADSRHGPAYRGELGNATLQDTPENRDMVRLKLAEAKELCRGRNPVSRPSVVEGLRALLKGREFFTLLMPADGVPLPGLRMQVALQFGGFKVGERVTRRELIAVLPSTVDTAGWRYLTETYLLGGDGTVLNEEERLRLTAEAAARYAASYAIWSAEFNARMAAEAAAQRRELKLEEAMDENPRCCAACAAYDPETRTCRASAPSLTEEEGPLWPITGDSGWCRAFVSRMFTVTEADFEY